MEQAISAVPSTLQNGASHQNANPKPDEEIRIFIRGITPDITPHELTTLISKFIPLINENPADLNLTLLPHHSAAFLTITSTQPRLEHMMQVLNGTRWKQSILRIERAKKSQNHYIERIEREKKEYIEVVQRVNDEWERSGGYGIYPQDGVVVVEKVVNRDVVPRMIHQREREILRSMEESENGSKVREAARIHKTKFDDLGHDVPTSKLHWFDDEEQKAMRVLREKQKRSKAAISINYGGKEDAVADYTLHQFLGVELGMVEENVKEQPKRDSEVQFTMDFLTGDIEDAKDKPKVHKHADLDISSSSDVSDESQSSSDDASLGVVSFSDSEQDDFEMVQMGEPGKQTKKNDQPDIMSRKREREEDLEEEQFNIVQEREIQRKVLARILGISKLSEPTMNAETEPVQEPLKDIPRKEQMTKLADELPSASDLYLEDEELAKRSQREMSEYDTQQQGPFSFKPINYNVPINRFQASLIKRAKKNRKRILIETKQQLKQLKQSEQSKQSKQHKQQQQAAFHFGFV